MNPKGDIKVDSMDHQSARSSQFSSYYFKEKKSRNFKMIVAIR